MLRYLIFVLLLLQALKVKADTDFKIGDVLLQPLKCWSCSLIEAEENTIFSHMGVVIAVEPEVIVAESFGIVRAVPLAVFYEKTEVGQKVLVRRFQNENLVADLQNSRVALANLFQEYFSDRKYDHDFLWDNLDEKGEEKLYCSEMVSKLFRAYSGSINTPIKRMHFNQNREHWIKYFKGHVPDGKWGNAPADYERSELFYSVGEL